MPDSAKLRGQLLLYLVLDPDHVAGDLLQVAVASIRGGVTAIQLRCKGRTDRAALELSRSVRGLTSDGGVLFLINDRVDLALAANADGVHLGIDDLPIENARTIGGPGFVVGYSPDTDEQATSARARGGDYLGVGPVFNTSTKADAGFAIGLEAVSRRAALAGIPTVGIGGITADSARSVIENGACGVAMVNAIAGQPDPEHAARQIRDVLAK